MIKTRKSIQKRFRVTKNGKVLHRKGPRSHFKAKKSGNVTRQKRGTKEFLGPDAKKIKLMI